MYIQKAEITNIKSIEHFEIEFKNPAGWHVLIGDNGSGKTTIVQSLALALIGNEEAYGLRLNEDHWITQKKEGSAIRVELLEDENIDSINREKAIPMAFSENSRFKIVPTVLLHRQQKTVFLSDFYPDYETMPMEYKDKGYFSCAFGPYRRFDGGSDAWKNIFENSKFANLAAHLSVFGEDVDFGNTIDWLKLLKYESYEENTESKLTLSNITKLINYEDEETGSFLPNNTKLEEVNSDGVYFKDGNGVTIIVNQLSDGYRSALSLVFELIRQLVRVYTSKQVFKHIREGEMFIDLPGVVLIDEIDAHLHPTWQTRIGQWFLKYFPQLQFIVTTHSPLVCRACGETGSIWQLKAPGSGEESHEVTGDNRNRLVYGNISDAFGTGVFGDKISITADANDMLNRLSELNVKSMMGLTNEKENEELQELRIKFPNDVTR
jgi:predicted ATP-binding protein involved in virulence